MPVTFIISYSFNKVSSVKSNIKSLHDNPRVYEFQILLMISYFHYSMLSIIIECLEDGIFKIIYFLHKICIIPAYNFAVCFPIDLEFTENLDTFFQLYFTQKLPILRQWTF